MHEREIKINGGLWDSYDQYKKESKYGKIDLQTYSKICQDFNKRVVNKVIKESFEFKVPFGLGYLRIKSTKPRLKIKDGKILAHKMAINWKASKELWARLYPDKTWDEIKATPNKKLVIFTNEHTDGQVMRWYWNKRLSIFKNQSLYMFKPVKGGVTADGFYSGRLGLGKWMKDPERTNEYYN